MVEAKKEVTCVRKHIEAFEQQKKENAMAAKEIEKGVAEVVAGIKAQEKELEKGVAQLTAGIRAQEKENAMAAKEIEKGVAEVVAGIRAQEKENAVFADIFYHGYAKK